MTAAVGATAGSWPSRWPAEDGGPRRRQRPRFGAGPGLVAGEVDVTWREAIAATMLVLRDAGELYALRAHPKK